MKTIFDYKPTEKELEYLGKDNFKNKEEYLEVYKNDIDSIYLHLAELFYKRGKKFRMRWYLAKIPYSMKMSFLNARNHF